MIASKVESHPMLDKGAVYIIEAANACVTEWAFADDVHGLFVPPISSKFGVTSIKAVPLVVVVAETSTVNHAVEDIETGKLNSQLFFN